MPPYYERDATACRRAGSTVMRRAMATALWRFSTTRMLHEYAELLYLPGRRASAVERVDERRRVVTEAG